MNNSEETETEEKDEILEKLRKEHPDVVKHTCADCGDLISYYDRDSGLDFDDEGKETHEPNDYILEEDDYYCPINPDNEGEPICEGCQETVSYRGSTLVVKTPAGDEHSLKFNSTFYIDGESIMDEIESCGVSKGDITALMQGRKYHRTDGWRGHYYSDPDKELFSTLGIDFTWLSGHHSNTLIMKQKELLEQAFKELDIPIFYCIHMSSNVFYQNIDAFVMAEHKDDADRIISFINDFTGAKDSRWSAGILMHLDEDKPLAERLEKQLDAQELPDDWSWKDFVENYDEMVEKVKKFKTEGFGGLSFNQQLGVMSGKGEMGVEMAQMMVALKNLESKKQGDTNESDD